MSAEFSLIDTWFAPLSDAIGDDCALLECPPGRRLATSTDTVVAGVHLPADASAEQISYRAVVTALSDLAAAGAEPLAIAVALTLPAPDPTWLAGFAAGLSEAMDSHGVRLLGGDTTSGPLTVTVQVFGTLPEGQGLQRSGARPGDGVYLSGCTGDAAAALAVMRGEWEGAAEHAEYLLQCFYRPQPRLQLGQQLLGIASSAIDVSDGVVADAGHICNASGVGMQLQETMLPLSAALVSLADVNTAHTLALTGGDDYQLLFTVPADREHQVPDGCTRIGEVVAGAGVSCGLELPSGGYEHFSAAPPAAAEEDGLPLTGVFGSWRQFVAFGFGSGLASRAPGTAGTALAVPLYLLLAPLDLFTYSLVIAVAAIFGIWVCDVASRELEVHDHPGIVWDEFVGFWVAMWALPAEWPWLLAGFVVFRVFDILKPWPISWCDRRVHGGLGIMLDDIVAGVFSCVLLHVALRLVS